MKVSDYIVDFLIHRGITDVFGYPGGMVTNLLESFRKRDNSISVHLNYHEQASAFSACGYAQSTLLPGVVYATSGPGATNLVTGICNAYFDSIPLVCITGQVNTYESKQDLKVRQRGFQETDIVDMVRNVTKYAVRIRHAEDVKFCLEKAWHEATTGRRGPVLLDIKKCEIEINEMPDFTFPVSRSEISTTIFNKVESLISQALRPCILFGAGMHDDRCMNMLKRLADAYSLPFVSSMLSVDTLSMYTNYYGFIGAYGSRVANFIVAKSDLIISVGARLDIRQVGAKKENFATNAKLIRVDIDSKEFLNKIKCDELQICDDAYDFLKKIYDKKVLKDKYGEWIGICDKIRELLSCEDIQESNNLINLFSKKVDEDINIVTDVGQNQVWVAQSFFIKERQKLFFSGGHGAMGYSLPAAIGMFYGEKKPVVSINGDGGIQMNIQELQSVYRDHLPITIVIVNNYSLGMIRHFQEMYFDSHYYQTTELSGYCPPDFEKISLAYGINYKRICNFEDLDDWKYDRTAPNVVELCIKGDTYVFPKLEYGKQCQDQSPLLSRELYNLIMEM